jgi:hypothetical protein
MASGYYNGHIHTMLDKEQDFPAFVWSVARGFGAFVMLRDEPSAPTPLAFEPEPYYSEELGKRIAARDEWVAKTPEEKVAWGENERQNEILRRQVAIKQTESEMDRMRAMREQVAAWEPPTHGHVELKKSMLDSIDTSLGDGDPTSYNRKALDEAMRRTALRFAADQEAKVESDVAYSEKALREEQNRVTSRNSWIAALNASVPLPEAALAKAEGRGL